MPTPPDSDRPRRSDVLPAPFAWIEIPGKGYSIAKYPVTNAQFARFIDAEGYANPQWWTEAGWALQEKEHWTGPRHLHNDPRWEGADLPVMDVSWYEAVAFCLWISAATGERIMLPTEDQWQYAAQGDDRRTYPWGNAWDRTRCNNSVEPYDSDGPTPVTHYEGRGDSPFGVVDMAGNAPEWCLTDYASRTNDPHSPSEARVLRGGAWSDIRPHHFRCAARYGDDPHPLFYFRGFRLARS